MAKLSDINSVTIVPLADLTARTKETTLTFTSTPAGWSTTKAVGVCTRDSNGQYRLKFNIAGSHDGTANITLGVSGVTFDSTANNFQSITGVGDGAIGDIRAYVNPGTSNITFGSASNTTTTRVSGNVLLAGKPSWFDANQENTFSVDARIDNATATTPGLLPGIADSTVFLDRGNGYGSTPSNRIRRFTNVRENTGTDITYTDSAADGASFTINRAGVYAIHFADANDVESSAFGISKNSTQLTTAITGINSADRMAITQIFDDNGVGNITNMCSVTLILAAGDVIRPHSSEVDYQNAVNFSTWFRITQIIKH